MHLRGQHAEHDYLPTHIILLEAIIHLVGRR